ncbi:hypothetical protein NFI96_009917 [Prochilodus magdalenae]|nr:hypothetical protein NFI96_009917 [Prochilodus magdalenae]
MSAIWAVGLLYSISPHRMGSRRPGVTPPPPLPHHLQELCEDVQAAWDGLSQDTIRNLYSSIPRRLAYWESSIQLQTGSREPGTGMSGGDSTWRVRKPRFSWTVDKEEKLVELWSGEECLIDVVLLVVLVVLEVLVLVVLVVMVVLEVLVVLVKGSQLVQEPDGLWVKPFSSRFVLAWMLRYLLPDGSKVVMEVSPLPSRLVWFIGRSMGKERLGWFIGRGLGMARLGWFTGMGIERLGWFIGRGMERLGWFTGMGMERLGWFIGSGMERLGWFIGRGMERLGWFIGRGMERLGWFIGRGMSIGRQGCLIGKGMWETGIVH